MNAKETYECTTKAMVQSAMNTVKGICEQISRAASECKFDCNVRFPEWMMKDKDATEGVVKAFRNLGYVVQDMTLKNDATSSFNISWRKPS